MIVKPMRATAVKAEDLKKLKFPLLAQPKFDGIRCIIQNSTALSNTLKPIRNSYVQFLAQNNTIDGFDGELISGNNFQETSSNIMSSGGSDDFTYYVFDLFDTNLVYTKRWKIVEDIFTHQYSDPRIVIVQSVRLRNIDQLLQYENQMLEEQHEGIMLRSPDGLYKYGRSTLNEHYLLKRKPFVDDEATIIGFEEQMENQNELCYDERGYAKRSSHQENKVGKGTLGYFIVKNLRWGEFKIGTGLGLTDSLRQEIWNNQSRYHHQIVTFKYQEHGIKDKPRTPIFLRFRHADDTLVEL